MDFTPTTESVRRDYSEHRKDCMHSPSYEQSRRFRESGYGEGEFNRWLAHYRESVIDEVEDHLVRRDQFTGRTLDVIAELRDRR